jgi:two-component sensor histidine kinase
MSDERHAATVGGLAAQEAIASGGALQALEANHRIANSLQLISALLSSQQREVTDEVARSALDMSVRRIAAIAGVHRQLYRAETTRTIDVATYLLDLTDGLEDGFRNDAGSRRLQLDADPCFVTPEFATTLGVIVTELVINACKYAYAPGEPGNVTVTFAATRNDFSLRVEDQGRGGIKSVPAVGLGSRIIDLMARRLDAEGGYLHQELGTAFRISGPLPRP